MDVEHSPSAYAERAPKPGDMLPGFALPSSSGELAGPRQFKGRRNLVLLFLHQACDSCRGLLADFAAHYEQYREEEAEILAIAPLSPEKAARLAAELRLPFPLLADPDRAVRRRYGGVGGAAVFLADRFGEIQQRWLAGDDHDRLPGQTALIEHLRFLGIQCPE